MKKKTGNVMFGNVSVRGVRVTIVAVEQQWTLHVALVSQYAKRMHRIILSSVACLPLPHFSTLSHKRLNGGRRRIRTNQDFYQLCGENDIVKFCKLSRLRWAGHVIRQDDDDLSRRVLLSEPGAKRPRGRHKLRWEDGVKEDAAKLGCRNWTVVALNREGWRKLLEQCGSRWTDLIFEYISTIYRENSSFVKILQE